GEPFGLAVGQDVRTVLRGEPAVGHSSYPLSPVAPDLALPVLELQDEQTARREHQSVDLVDRPISANELDICPHMVRVRIGQVGGQVTEAILLVREGARVDLLPPRRILAHAAPPLRLRSAQRRGTPRYRLQPESYGPPGASPRRPYGHSHLSLSSIGRLS